MVSLVEIPRRGSRPEQRDARRVARPVPWEGVAGSRSHKDSDGIAKERKVRA